MDRAGHDQRFRRARLSRFADADTLDRLEAEHAEMTVDEQCARNEQIDTLSDDEIRSELFGDLAATDSDGDKPKRNARRTARTDDGDGDSE